MSLLAPGSDARALAKSALAKSALDPEAVDSAILAPEHENRSHHFSPFDHAVGSTAAGGEQCWSCLEIGGHD